MEALRFWATTAALALSLTAQSEAQWLVDSPTADVNAATQIAKAVQQVNQTISLVQSAKQELQQLPASFRGTNITGRLTAVTSLLQTAQAACINAQFGRTMPSTCKVNTNVALSQASQLGAAMATLGSIKNAATGSFGGLQATQTAAHGIIEAATQLQELHQLWLASATQTAIDGHVTTQATAKVGTVNPW